MSSNGPGLWVTGPSRSGTSLVAGLFAAHGVFFGDTQPGDEHNPKGYFEHPCLISRQSNADSDLWPQEWWDTLKSEGWDGVSPWGVKRGPFAWPLIRQLQPDFVVLCQRPEVQQLASRARRWPERKGQHIQMMRGANAELRRVLTEVEVPVFRIRAPDLIVGKRRAFKRVIKRLGITFNEKIVRDWIDPSIWNRGLK